MVWEKLLVLAVGAAAAVVVYAVDYYLNRPPPQRQHGGTSWRGEGGAGGTGGGGSRGGGRQGGEENGPRQTWRSEERSSRREISPSQLVRRRQIRSKPGEKGKEQVDREKVRIKQEQRRDDSESRRRKDTTRPSSDVEVTPTEDQCESGRRRVTTRPSSDEEHITTEGARLVNTTGDSEVSDAGVIARQIEKIERRAPADYQAYLRKPRPVQQTKMQVPANSIGVWKFGEENFFTTVPKVWAVSDCIAHVQNKIGRHGYGDLDLWVRNRCIMLDKKKTLSDYPGLKSLHVVRRPSSRNPHPLYQTSRADDIDPYCDDTRVVMYCGHATSPENLYDYAWQKIQNGATEVTCPAIPDANKPCEQCLKVWEFKSISMLACLSEDEKYLFCEKMFLNWLDKNPNVYLCPVCNEAIRSSCTNVFKCFNCEKDGKIHSFCIKCNRVVYGNTCYQQECQESLPKMRDRLKNCQKRTLVGVPNCPSVRACPECQRVIEYDEEDSCKHMTCPRNTCGAKFCFICLKVKTDQHYWPCGGAFQPCKPSPVQVI